MEDYDNVYTSNIVLHSQLENAKRTIKEYEQKIIEKDALLHIMECKTREAQQDAEQMRDIMTKNITQSNLVIEELSTKNQRMATIIRELRNKDGDNNRLANEND